MFQLRLLESGDRAFYFEYLFLNGSSLPGQDYTAPMGLFLMDEDFGRFMS